MSLSNIFRQPAPGPDTSDSEKKSMSKHIGGCFVAVIEELTEMWVQLLKALKRWGMLIPSSVTCDQHRKVGEVKHRAKTRLAGQIHTPDL